MMHWIIIKNHDAFDHHHNHNALDHHHNHDVSSQLSTIPHICHGLTDGVRGEKIFHVEKFQISVHDRCGEI